MSEASSRIWGNIRSNWLPYILLAIALGFALWTVNHAQEQRDEDRSAELVNNCQTLKKSVEAGNKTLSKLIENTTEPMFIPIPVGADEGLTNLINGFNERAVSNSATRRAELLTLIKSAPEPKCALNN